MDAASLIQERSHQIHPSRFQQDCLYHPCEVTASSVGAGRRQHCAQGMISVLIVRINVQEVANIIDSRVDSLSMKYGDVVSSPIPCTNGCGMGRRLKGVWLDPARTSVDF